MRLSDVLLTISPMKLFLSQFCKGEVACLFQTVVEPAPNQVCLTPKPIAHKT
jgi:hypothetical protein